MSVARSTLVANALGRVGELDDGTSDFATLAVTYAKRAYREFLLGGMHFLPAGAQMPNWSDLLSSSTSSLGVNDVAYTPLSLVPEVTQTFTASVTQNSTSVTLSATYATSLAGYFIKFTGHAIWYRITAHTAGTAALTLDVAYAGSTDGTIDVEHIVATDYLNPLSSTKSIISGPIVNRQTGETCQYLSRDEFNRRWPRHTMQAGFPENYTLLGVFEQTLLLRFSHYGNASGGESIIVDIPIVVNTRELTSDSTVTALPDQFDHIVEDMLCYYLSIDRDDTKAQGFYQQVQNGLLAVIKQYNAGFRRSYNFGRVFPRLTTKNPPRILRTDNGSIIG